MSEAETNRWGDFDPGLFSPEELEMMREAEGSTGEPGVKPDAEELQAQLTAVARLVAEGGERERQLRALVADLTMLGNPVQQQQSVHEQTQRLAQIVLASSERELQLQQCLDTVRSVVLVRAKGVI